MTERKPKHMEIHAEVVRSGDAASCPVLRAGVGGRYRPHGAAPVPSHGFWGWDGHI